MGSKYIPCLKVTFKAYKVIEFKIGIPQMRSVVARKADTHRTLGKTKRSFTNAEKERTKKNGSVWIMVRPL